MIRFNPALGLSAALLLAIPLAGAEYRDPSGYEPPPFFEDEGLVGNIDGYRKPAAVPQPSPPPALVKPPEPVRAEPEPVPAPESPAAKPGPANTGAAASAVPLPATAAPTESPAALPGLLTDNAPVGLILIALAGWVFWNTRKPGAARRGVRASPAVIQDTPASIVTPEAQQGSFSAETGVARYLRSRGSR